MKTIVRLLIMTAIGFGIPVRSQAQTYPAKPIKIIVPSPGGTTTDTLARIIAEKLQEKWGQPVIVDDRAGTAGNSDLARGHRATRACRLPKAGGG
jgi:tripartite-type tricarboxylate transporter receptor subunit TctC